MESSRRSASRAGRSREPADGPSGSYVASASRQGAGSARNPREPLLRQEYTCQRMLAMAELIPHLGDPVVVQRRLEYTIAPDLESTVLCYLDSRRSSRTSAATCRRRSSTSRSRTAQ